MSATDHLLHANERYAATFPGPRPLRPKLRTAVVTCMDSRLDLFGALGLEVGDAHLIRNAGGIPTEDVLRSLAISQHKLGTREIIVIHHTQCGMAGFDDDAFRAELAAASGAGTGLAGAGLRRHPGAGTPLPRDRAHLRLAAAPRRGPRLRLRRRDGAGSPRSRADHPATSGHDIGVKRLNRVVTRRVRDHFLPRS